MVKQEPRAALPVNPEAEMSLLGAVLLDNTVWDKVCDIVSADHFSDVAHALIWSAMTHLLERGRGVTPVTLHGHLAELELDEDVGGAQYLAHLAAVVLTTANAADMAREVRDTWIRREVILWARTAEERAQRSDFDDDTGEMLDELDQQLVNLRTSHAPDDTPTSMAHHANKAKEEILAAYANGGPVRGMATGFKWIDDKLKNGLSDLIIIAGRPSMGKTALALNIAEKLAVEQGKRGLIASLEMTGDDLVARMVASRLNIPGDRLMSGDLTEAEAQRVWEVEQEIAKLPLHIDDRSAQTPAAIRSRARSIQRREGLDFVVIDYLQIMQPPDGRRYSSNNDTVTAISMSCKRMAKDLGVPVILLSQLSRNVEQRADKRPQLADLRDGGAIEQDADIVMFVYRAEYYLANEQPQRHDFKNEETFLEAEANWASRLASARGRADIIIAKNRKGQTGTAHMWFAKATTQFSDFGDAAGAEPAPDPEGQEELI